MTVNDQKVQQYLNLPIPVDLYLISAILVKR